MIIVVGGGAVGSFLAWAMATGGREVTLVRRAHEGGPHPEGLTVIDPKGESRAASVTVIAHPGEASDPPELIVLTVKMYDLVEAVASCGLWSAAPVVTVQNGIGAEDLVRAARPGAGLVAASLTAAIEPAGQGEWGWLRRGGIGLAAVHGDVAPVVDGLRSILTGAGLSVRVFSDATAMKWSKLLGNLVANATAAILDMDAGDIYRHPDLFRIERAQIREAEAVMSAFDIEPVALPGADVRLLLRALDLPSAIARPLVARVVGGARGGKAPSLLLHARSRPAPSEVDWLNGGVARAGAMAGIPTPVNTKLTKLVNEILTGTSRRAWFHRRPDRLVAEMSGSSV